MRWNCRTSEPLGRPACAAVTRHELLEIEQQLVTHRHRLTDYEAVLQQDTPSLLAIRNSSAWQSRNALPALGQRSMQRCNSASMPCNTPLPQLNTDWNLSSKASINTGATSTPRSRVATRFCTSRPYYQGLHRTPGHTATKHTWPRRCNDAIPSSRKKITSSARFNRSVVPLNLNGIPVRAPQRVGT